MYYDTNTYRQRTFERKQTIQSQKKPRIKGGEQPFNYNSNSVESKGEASNSRRLVEVLSPEFNGLRKLSDSRSSSNKKGGRGLGGLGRNYREERSGGKEYLVG